MLLAGCYAVVGFFLRRRRVWARNFAFAFAAVSLFAFPVGTALGAFVVLCIDRANRAGVCPGRVRIARATLPAAAEDEAPFSASSRNSPPSTRAERRRFRASFRTPCRSRRAG